MSKTSAATNIAEDAVAYIKLGALRAALGRIRATDARMLAVQVSTAGVRISAPLPGGVCAQAFVANEASASHGDATLWVSPQSLRAAVFASGTDFPEEIRVRDGRLTVGRQRVEGLPALPAPPRGGVALPAATLRRALALGGYAASGDDTRPHLAAVHIAVGGDGAVTVESTDGHRAATARVAADACETIDVLVPGAAPEAVHAMLKKANAAARLSPTALTIADDSVTWEAVDGRFPDLAYVMPAADRAECVVRVGRRALLTALGPVDDYVTLWTAHGQAPLGVAWIARATTGDGAQCAGNCVAEVMRGEARATFNIAYLRTALEADTADDVTLAFNGATLGPLRIDGDAVHVVMPRRA